VYSSIVELAKKCKASVAAIAKFSKAIEYKDFSEVEINLARELVSPDGLEERHILA
jgi:DNA-binding MurR/RpiR family transcriptional regulator